MIAAHDRVNGCPVPDHAFADVSIGLNERYMGNDGQVEATANLLGTAKGFVCVVGEESKPKPAQKSQAQRWEDHDYLGRDFETRGGRLDDLGRIAAKISDDVHFLKTPQHPILELLRATDIGPQTIFLDLIS